MASTVIIVGAGAGGIATAARLAKSGFQVKVVERNNFIGGRCSVIHKDGYRFDQGPSLVLMPELFKEIFHDLGTSLESEQVELRKCEPNYVIWFADNDTFEMTTDLSRMKSQINKLEGKDSFHQFHSFMQESGTHYELSLSHVLKRNFPRLFSMLRPPLVESLLAMHPFECVYTRVAKYFKSDKLQRVFTFGTMYLGMSPFQAPATYSLLQYTEIADGIWYPKGGFQIILKALANVGKRLGVEYRLNSAVSSILLSEDKKHATGVRLASGEELHADIVVVNADLVYAYNNLLPPSPEALSLQERPASCSSISFFWSFDCVVPELRPHNIFLADQYEQSFDSIFVEHRIPDEPSFYVNVPSRIDDTAAPPGNDAVVVLVPVGHLVKDRFGEFIRDHEAWDVHISHTRDFVLNVIEARTGVKGLRKKIVSESVETPLSWETKFNLDRGAILGLSHSFFNVLSFRPKTRHSELRGLYFVGASTHPGTGVPICLAGSKITAKQITQDLDRDKSALTNWLGLVLWLVFGGMVAFLGILGGYGVAMGF